MIHQFILAAPKPGMTAAEFQDYWTNVHAVKFAARIPQIRRYLIDSRVPFDADRGRPALPHQGIAEIWLENDEEQLASLQTEEFLQGARRDEPNWAAFWLTIVLDTEAHEIVAGPPPAEAGRGG
ncbi:EthD domain-containing protein [Planomonospora algeriensis]